MANKSTKISEAKIRQALWMLKKNKTKKVVCDHLGIAYNPKRLQTILDNFQIKTVREKELKRKARFKEFTNKEKEEIVVTEENPIDEIVTHEIKKEPTPSKILENNIEENIGNDEITVPQEIKDVH